MAEAGYPGRRCPTVERRIRAGGDAAPIVAKLEKALSEAIRDPDVSAKLKNLAVDPGGGPPEDFKRTIESDIVKFRDVVKAANLHFEE